MQSDHEKTGFLSTCEICGRDFKSGRRRALYFCRECAERIRSKGLGLNQLKSVSLFNDNDQAYEQWLDEVGGNGFVYNDFGGKDVAYKKLHCSGCRWLHTGVGKKTSVRKICSPNLEELIAFLEEVRGPEGEGFSQCRTCTPLEYRPGSLSQVREKVVPETNRREKQILKPEITVSIESTAEFVVNGWDQVSLVLANNGSSPASNLHVQSSDCFECDAWLPGVLEPGTSTKMNVSIKPQEFGKKVPLVIILHFQNEDGSMSQVQANTAVQVQKSTDNTTTAPSQMVVQGNYVLGTQQTIHNEETIHDHSITASDSVISQKGDSRQQGFQKFCPGCGKDLSSLTQHPNYCPYCSTKTS